MAPSLVHEGLERAADATCGRRHDDSMRDMRKTTNSLALHMIIRFCMPTRNEPKRSHEGEGNPAPLRITLVGGSGSGGRDRDQDGFGLELDMVSIVDAGAGRSAGDLVIHLLVAGLR
jgi:hypothetical protein